MPAVIVNLLLGIFTAANHLIGISFTIDLVFLNESIQLIESVPVTAMSLVIPVIHLLIVKFAFAISYLNMCYMFICQCQIPNSPMLLNLLTSDSHYQWVSVCV